MRMTILLLHRDILMNRKFFLLLQKKRKIHYQQLHHIQQQNQHHLQSTPSAPSVQHYRHQITASTVPYMLLQDLAHQSLRSYHNRLYVSQVKLILSVVSTALICMNFVLKNVTVNTAYKKYSAILKKKVFQVSQTLV